MLNHSCAPNVVLDASVLIPAAQQHLGPSLRCRLPILPKAVLVIVSEFMDIKIGAPLRRIRIFEEHLTLAASTSDRRAISAANLYNGPDAENT